MTLDLLYKGMKADIRVIADDHGRRPADEFIEDLTLPMQKKVVALLRKFADLGGIRNEQQFRCEENPIYVFKANQARICCFFLPFAKKKTVILAHGFTKKQNEMQRRHLEKAKGMYREILKNIAQRN